MSRPSPHIYPARANGWFRAGGEGEAGLQPGRQFVVVGQGGTSASSLMLTTAILSKAAIRRAEGSVKALSLRVREDPVRVPVPRR
jgi:hypothetical protein